MDSVFPSELSEKSPQVSQLQLHTILDALPALVAYVDTDHRYQFVNQAYEHWYGVSCTEIIGQPVAGFLGEAAYAERLPHIRQALAGKTVRYETEMMHKERGLCQTIVNYVPDRKPDSSIAGIVVLVWDITPRKQAENTLQILQQDHEALLNSIEGVVWEADADTFEFSFISQQIERLLGFPISNWLSNPEFWKSCIHPDDREKTLRICIDATARGENHDFEYRMVKSDGDIVWVRDIVSVYKTASKTLLRGVMIDVTRERNAEEQLEYLSNYDLLTQLPNRNLFMDRLERALAYSSWHQRPLAVLSVGVSRLKRINESFGHEAGDDLLRQIALRLREILRERDTIARLAGNEFAILLTDMSRKSDITRILEKLHNEFQKPFYINANELMIGLNIGISMPPGDGEDPRVLLKKAETAMQQTIQSTGVQYQHYSVSLGEKINGIIDLENALRRALAEQEFELHYQPQISLNNNSVAGVEALLRWRRPDKAVDISPAEFIPIAEESGLIIPIGNWVLHQACQDYRRWKQQGIAPSRVAVNISARQLLDSGLVDEVEFALREYSIRPNQLELELTESVAQHAEAAEQMERLARLGVKIAIDDFGIGYSSLSYLKHLPVHKLKIDRSFVQGLPRDDDYKAIVEAIIAMARSLKLQVIAEGVETATQRRFLRGKGCFLMQGFLYSKALPLAELEAFLQAHKAEN
ncbi:MAG: EAL domain-containing protein [Gammaproteobacteria bacterium]